MFNRGFTLSEVLITLGIIGVVAAMTIPTLIANTNCAKYRSQFKKSVSTLNQAVRMSVANEDKDFSRMSGICSNGEGSYCTLLKSTLVGGKSLSYADDEIKNYIIVSTRVTLFSTKTAYTYYMMADGTLIAFNTLAKGCSLAPGQTITPEWLEDKKTSCVGFIDVNGLTGPNKEVTCSDGTATANDPANPCVVTNDTNHLTDIYPVVYYNATVAPATNAAAYVLNTAK